MKRFTTLTTLFCMFFLSLTAQEVKLTVETTAGNLKDSISSGQRKTVTNLTLTGSMNDADFYLIRDSMPKLKSLDMKYVTVDTIPQKAFSEYRCSKYILPVNLKYIDDYAFEDKFYSHEIVITGAFPKLGYAVFFGNGVNLTLSEDNTHCKQNTSIYSMNGKILYYSKANFSEIEKGTEIIESRAFDSTSFVEISLPSTLKLIKEYAFTNIDTEQCNNFHGFRYTPFICYGNTPPVLEKNAFYRDRDSYYGKDFSMFKLYVPKGEEEAYREADPQWSKFYSINDEDPVVIKSNDFHSLTVNKEQTGIQIRSEKSFSQVMLYTLSGECCYHENMTGTEIHIPRLSNNEIYLLKVIFKDHSVSHLKIII